jgi:hypothetical protein
MPLALLDQALAALPPSPALAGQGGLLDGTPVLTLDGAIPVEFLSPGDPIITRAGLVRLVAVAAEPVGHRPLVRVGAGILSHDRPGADVILAAEQTVLLRGHRAQMLFGADIILVPVARLVDGRHITRLRIAAAHRRLYRLGFDTAEVIYADGAEVGGAVTVPVTA